MLLGAQNRLCWKNEDIDLFLISQRMFPPVALAVPFYFFNWLRMLDKLSTLILVYTAMNAPLVSGYCGTSLPSCRRRLKNRPWSLAVRGWGPSSALPCYWPCLD